jgi:hypothetical protein
MADRLNQTRAVPVPAARCGGAPPHRHVAGPAASHPLAGEGRTALRAGLRPGQTLHLMGCEAA